MVYKCSLIFFSNAVIDGHIIYKERLLITISNKKSNGNAYFYLILKDVASFLASPLTTGISISLKVNDPSLAKFLLDTLPKAIESLCFKKTTISDKRYYALLS